MSNSGVVKVTIGITKNLGNYENIKLDFGVEVAVDDVYDEEEWAKAKDQVDKQFGQTLEEVTRRVKGE